MSNHCIICTGNVIKSSFGAGGVRYDASYSLCYTHYTETRQFVTKYLLTKYKTSAWSMAISIIRDLYLVNKLV